MPTLHRSFLEIQYPSRVVIRIDSSPKRRNNAQPVTEFPKRDITNTSLFGGLLLLLCALTFYYFAVLRIDYQKTALLDLGPHPDATEYFAQAETLSKGGQPTIQIGYETLPSRYPPGYPALMLPWLKILVKRIPFWPHFGRIRQSGCYCFWPYLFFTSTWRCL